MNWPLIESGWIDNGVSKESKNIFFQRKLSGEVDKKLHRGRPIQTKLIFLYNSKVDWWNIKFSETALIRLSIIVSIESKNENFYRYEIKFKNRSETISENFIFICDQSNKLVLTWEVVKASLTPMVTKSILGTRCI